MSRLSTNRSVDFVIPVDDRCPRSVSCHPFSTVICEPVAIIGIVQELLTGMSESRRISRGVHKTGFPVSDDFAEGGKIGNDQRSPESHGLEGFERRHRSRHRLVGP